MFTGIIKAVGRVAASEARGGDRRLRIASDALPWLSYAEGDSIAVNGVCLTAVSLFADGFETDVSNETLSVTTLGGLAVGGAVNLEPALAVGDRLGGHIVSGHVDGVGRVTRRETDARAVQFDVTVPPALARYVAKKGSVAIDGVSLTINEVSGDCFSVTIIPHTINETIIGSYAPGTTVNIEVDQLARYLERLLGAGDSGPDSRLSREFLKAHGYG